MSTIYTGSIEERVKKCLREQAESFGPEAGDFGMDASLAGVLGLDSLDLVEVTMALEDEFGIEIDDDQMHAFETVQQVIDAVRERVKA